MSHTELGDDSRLTLLDRQFEFGLESYKQVRSEVAGLLTRIENLFRYSLVASVSVFAWLLTQAFGVTATAAYCIKLPVDALNIAWLLPPAFIIVSGLAVLATHVRILQMSQFLHRCEVVLGHPRLSWEQHLATKGPLFTVSSVIAWVVMLAAAGVATSVGLDLSELATCSASK